MAPRTKPCTAVAEKRKSGTEVATPRRSKAAADRVEEPKSEAKGAKRPLPAVAAAEVDGVKAVKLVEAAAIKMQEPEPAPPLQPFDEADDAEEPHADEVPDFQTLVQLAQAAWAPADASSGGLEPRSLGAPCSDEMGTCLPFRHLAVALEASSTGARAPCALANLFHWVLAGGSSNRAQDLAALLAMLLPHTGSISVSHARRRSQDLAAATTTAFRLKVDSGSSAISPGGNPDALAEVALGARRRQPSLLFGTPRVLKLVDVAAALAEFQALQSGRANALDATGALVERLAQLIGKSGTQSRETFHLIRILHGQPGVVPSPAVVLRALAHGLILGELDRSATPEDMARVEEAVGRAWKERGEASPKTFVAALLCAGGVEGVVDPSSAIEAACRANVGCLVRPMKADTQVGIFEALQQLSSKGGGAVFIEKLLEGERAQVHVTDSGSTFQVFVKGLLRPDRAEKMPLALRENWEGVDNCIIEVMLMKPPKVFTRSFKRPTSTGDGNSAESLGAMATAPAGPASPLDVSPFGELDPLLSPEGAAFDQDGKLLPAFYKGLIESLRDGAPRGDDQAEALPQGVVAGESVPEGLRSWDDSKGSRAQASSGAGWIASAPVKSSGRTNADSKWFNIKTWGSWRLAFLLARLQRSLWELSAKGTLPPPVGNSVVAAKVASETSSGFAAFTVVVFDMLVLNSQPLTRLPLRERRAALTRTIKQTAGFRLAEGSEVEAGAISVEVVKAQLNDALSSYWKAFTAEAADRASRRASGLVLKLLDGKASEYCAGRRSTAWQVVQKPPAATGPEADSHLFGELSEEESALLAPVEEFRFCVISARRTQTEEGRRDIMLVQNQLTASGAVPVWYVDAPSLDGYRALGLEAKVGGKLIPARNMALNDATEFSKVCVQVSDDIACWNFYKGESEEREKHVSLGNAAASLAERYQVSPVAAARFLLAKMRGMKENKAQLGGVYPLGNTGQAFSSYAFSTKSFILGDFFVVDKSPCRFDESMSLKEDYDLTCKHLIEHGAVLRCNRLLIQAKHESNSGGACSIRDAAGERERHNIAILQKKYPGVFSANPTRPNQVVLRWKQDSLQACLDAREALKKEAALPAVVPAHDPIARKPAVVQNGRSAAKRELAAAIGELMDKEEAQPQPQLTEQVSSEGAGATHLLKRRRIRARKTCFAVVEATMGKAEPASEAVPEAQGSEAPLTEVSVATADSAQPVAPVQKGFRKSIAQKVAPEPPAAGEATLGKTEAASEAVPEAQGSDATVTEVPAAEADSAQSVAALQKLRKLFAPKVAPEPLAAGEDVD